jgi:hypothetical protein
MVSVVNISVMDNSDFRREFAVVDDDGVLRTDLHLSQLFFQVRRDPSSKLVLINAATDPKIGGLQFLAPLNSGRFVMMFRWKLLNDIGPGSFRHDLIEVTPLNLRRPIWRGAFTIEEGVTL